MKDTRIQVEASKLLRALNAERKKQEKLEKEAAESSEMVQVLKEQYLRENRHELYCYIAAEFLKHYKKYIPDLTKVTKKELRDFIRHLPFPNEVASVASDSDDMDCDARSVTENGANSVTEFCMDTNTNAAVNREDWYYEYNDYEEENPVRSTGTEQGVSSRRGGL